MKECLNQRDHYLREYDEWKANYHETQKYEPQGKQEKFPSRNKSPQEKPTPDSNARRRKALTRKEKRIRAIMRGDTLWTPGCGIILSIREK